MTVIGASSDLRRALSRLDPGDPAGPLVELASENADPTLTAAVVRKLLAEIRAERST